MRYVQKLALLAGSLLAATAWGATPAHTCVTSGTGPTYMKVCISKQGNVVKFESPQGKDHIRIGNQWGILEGYAVSWVELVGGDRMGICEVGDAAIDDCGSSVAPYKIEQPNGANTFPLRLYSRPGGGWEMKQEFNRDNTERELTIVMTLTNRSGDRYHDVYFARLASFGIDNDFGDDNVYVSNNWDASHCSLVAWEGTGVGNAVGMTTPSCWWQAVWWSPGLPYWEDPFLCEGGSSYGPNAEPIGVVGGLKYYLGEWVNNGASKTIKVLYRAF